MSTIILQKYIFPRPHMMIMLRYCKKCTNIRKKQHCSRMKVTATKESDSTACRSKRCERLSENAAASLLSLALYHFQFFLMWNDKKIIISLYNTNFPTGNWLLWLLLADWLMKSIGLLGANATLGMYASVCCATKAFDLSVTLLKTPHD